MEFELQTKDRSDKHPTTWWLVVLLNVFDADERTKLADIESRLKEIGFERCKHEAPPMPSGSHEAHFSKPGSDIFRGWNLEEYYQNMAALDALFESMPAIPVFERELTLRDVL